MSPRMPTTPDAMTDTPDHGRKDQPAVDRDGGLVRLRCDIAYDGTEFSGWAAQAGRRTVAGVLDEALSTIFRTPVRLYAAGRTDTGVHAAGQVAHVDIPAEALPNAYPRAVPRDGDEFLPLVRRLARFVPPDIRVLAVRRAADGFDARFAALRRHYVYRLSTAPYGVLPHQARYVAAWSRAPDLEAMATASRRLLGQHDFAAFCRHRDGATTIRELQRFDWSRDGSLVTAHVTADAFCWSMVRSLVGALLAVGTGRRSPEWAASLLGAARRSSDFAVAPACGLTLAGVDYPPDDRLAERAAVTRRRRGP